MSKQNAINLDVTPNTDGYSVGGGTTKRTLTISGSDINIISYVTSSNLTISGSDITLIGGSTATITFPTQSATMAATDLSNIFAVPQYFASSSYVTGSLILSGSTPASVSASGVPGSIVYSNGYFYFCTGSNAWTRLSGSSF